MDDEQRALYDTIVSGPRAATASFSLTDASGRLEGPFNAMLVAAPLGSALQELGAAIRYRSTLSDRQREIAILELARIRRSEFEWYAHSRVARACGLSDDAIAALRAGDACEELDSRESLVRETVAALVATRDLDEDRYRRAVADLGLRALAELITLVGYYDALALSLRAWRTPLPAGAERAFPSPG